MDTRNTIIRLGDALIRERGYNAFSFSDIARQLHIRNASVHYHFPAKSSLGIAVVQDYIDHLEEQRKELDTKPVMEQLDAFLDIYDEACATHKVCIVGALATDWYTLDVAMQEELKVLVAHILAWVMDILEAGKTAGLFTYHTDTRTRALLLITNMLAAVQLCRLTQDQDFQHIKQTVVNDLMQQKHEKSCDHRDGSTDPHR